MPELPQQLCPLEGCLETFSTSAALREHIILHLLCRWFTCPHCPKNFFYHDKTVEHIGTCTERPPDVPASEPRERFDARYPLLRMWALGMDLPAFKNDGSRDARLVVGPGQVWECARNSLTAYFVPAA